MRIPPLNVTAEEYRQAVAQLTAQRHRGHELDPSSPEGRELLRVMDIVETWECMVADAVREYEYCRAVAALAQRLDYGRETDPESPLGRELLQLVDIVEGRERMLIGLRAL